MSQLQVVAKFIKIIHEFDPEAIPLVCSSHGWFKFILGLDGKNYADTFFMCAKYLKDTKCLEEMLEKRQIVDRNIIDAKMDGFLRYNLFNVPIDISVFLIENFGIPAGHWISVYTKFMDKDVPEISRGIVRTSMVRSVGKVDPKDFFGELQNFGTHLKVSEEHQKWFFDTVGQRFLEKWLEKKHFEFEIDSLFGNLVHIGAFDLANNLFLATDCPPVNIGGLKLPPWLLERIELRKNKRKRDSDEN